MLINKHFQVFIFGLLVIACSSEEVLPLDQPKTEEEIKQEIFEGMAHGWIVKSVTLDGVANGDHSKLALSISGTLGASSFGYSTQGSGSPTVWAPSGFWKFGKDYEREIIRDPGSGAELILNYTLKGEELKISFQLNGKWVFAFERQ